MPGSVTASLDELAREINAEHAAVGDAMVSMLSRARRAGELLTTAKQQLEHGQWGPWLATHFDGSERTARAYMQVARRWEEIGQKTAGAAVLSLDGALKLLAEPREHQNGERPDAATSTAVPPPPSRSTAAVPPSITHDADESRKDEDDAPEAGTGDPPEDDEPDPVAEWEAAQKEVERLEDLVESLQTGDLHREVTAWSAKYAQLEGRVRQLTTEANAAKRQAKSQAALLKRITTTLGVEQWGEIVPAIQDLMR